MVAGEVNTTFSSLRAEDLILSLALRVQRPKAQLRSWGLPEKLVRLLPGVRDDEPMAPAPNLTDDDPASRECAAQTRPQKVSSTM